MHYHSQHAGWWSPRKIPENSLESFCHLVRSAPLKLYLHKSGASIPAKSRKSIQIEYFNRHLFANRAQLREKHIPDPGPAQPMFRESASPRRVLTPSPSPPLDVRVQTMVGLIVITCYSDNKISLPHHSAIWRSISVVHPSERSLTERVLRYHERKRRKRRDRECD